LCVGLLLCASDRIAQAQASADKAAADALFEEGKKLINKPDDVAAWRAACDKFDASTKKLMQLGAQISLAYCYEKISKTASAFGAFRTALTVASKAHDKRQTSIEQHMTALEAKVPKIVIRVDMANRVDGLQIRYDGVDVSAGEFGAAIPIDPGEHIVEARAPGRIVWWTKVSIPANPGIVEIPVPALEKVSAPPDARPTRRIVMYGTAGGGVALVTASLIFGAIARSKWNDVEQHCPTHVCAPADVNLASSAKTMGNVATGTFLVGMSALAGAAILFLSESSGGVEHKPMTGPTISRISPALDGAQVGITIRGAF
jgi:hypothetical protein